MTMFFGKVMGALFGYLLAGPFGLLLGLFIGHHFDKALKLNMFQSRHFFSPYTGSPIQVQTIFFETTFQVMGYLAKADGQVSERELSLARSIMQRMGLNADQTLRAMRLFNEGKSANFDVDRALESFFNISKHKWILVQMFLEIQLQVALAEGKMSPPAQAFLERCSIRFGLPPGWVERMSASVGAEQFFHGQRSSRGSAYQHQPRQESLSEAYHVLGVDRSVSDAALKKAYRKRMSEHHPDKLAAKGLPPEMMKLATEKTQQIQNAYAVIAKARGL